MVANFLFIFVAFVLVNCQKDGDSCNDKYTSSVGRCTSLDKCRSAKNDFQQNGVPPTFCTYNTFGSSLVCCRDGNTILQASKQSQDQSVWGSADAGLVPINDSRRVSARKCEEYNKGVIEKVTYIPLLPNPDALSITAAKCDYTGVELIVGGQDAKQGEFPHMAAVGWSNFKGGYSFLCGGSPISPLYVLTAGHCFQTRDTRVTDPSPVIARLGDQNIDPSVKDGADPIDVPIRRSIKHPSYAPPSTYDDIALLELAARVTFSASVRPACLWTEGEMRPLGSVALATGWGVTDTAPGSQQTSKELQKVSLSILDNAVCDKILQSIRNRNWAGFRDTQMCAGELRGGKDTCQGDSGSPLQVASKNNQCIFYLIGVTSFGRRCAVSGRPAIYTRISTYVPWIESVVWPGE